MKKLFILVIISAVLLCGCEEKKANNVDIKDETKTTEKISSINITTETTSTTTNSKTTTSTKTTSKEESTTKKVTTKKVTTTKTTNKSTTANKTDSNGGPYYYEGSLPECSDNDSGLKSYINKLEKEGTYKYFLTYKESRDYGEYAALKLGYGYWYHQKDNPRAVYRGNNCYRELWAVQLYIPSKTCKMKDGSWNKTLNLPVTSKEDLVTDRDYLRKLGYVCDESIYDCTSGTCVVVTEIWR